MVNNILLNTADNYPQAPASGGTQRMRKVITDINKVDNPDNDLIYNNGIRIENYIEVVKEGIVTKEIKPKGEDFTRLIMDVVNKVIGVTQ